MSMQIFYCLSRRHFITFFLGFCFMLSGCAIGGFKFRDDGADFAPDRSLITGSIDASKQVLDDAVGQLDKALIIEKVGNMQLPQSQDDNLAWDNEKTGSQGVIANVTEATKNGALCRQFDTSRAAFDGQALYEGKICKISGRNWAMVSFSQKE